MREPKVDKSQDGAQRTLGQKMAYASEVAMTLPASVCAGWVFGRLLDGWCGSHLWQVAGIVVGAIAGMARLAQIALRADHTDDAPPDDAKDKH